MSADHDTLRLLYAAKIGEAFLETGDSWRSDYVQRGWIVKVTAEGGLVQIEVPVVRYCIERGWIVRGKRGKVVLTQAGERAWQDLALVTA